eukprot:COSAG06_NODE_27729_length_587_cov_1.112705_1_plen_38_part_10
MCPTAAARDRRLSEGRSVTANRTALQDLARQDLADEAA